MKKIFITLILFFVITISIFASNWTYHFFVDDFGDTTNEGYIEVHKKIKYGEYSWEEDYCSILIECYENISFYVGKTYYNEWTIKIKDYEGLIHSYKGEISKYTSRVYLVNNDDNKEILNAMKKGCKIILIPDNIYANKKYDFGMITITDSDLDKIKINPDGIINNKINDYVLTVNSDLEEISLSNDTMEIVENYRISFGAKVFNSITKDGKIYVNQEDYMEVISILKKGCLITIKVSDNSRKSETIGFVKI